jgi:hypothetical protein
LRRSVGSLHWWTSVLARRGHDSTDASSTTYTTYAERARTELLAAANAETGLFDLVLLDGSGISKGGMISYSETSPFLGARLQRANGRREDAAGSGTLHGRRK